MYYTNQPRPTDMDLAGRITPDDLEALAGAGFERHGRHWLHAWTSEGGFVEVPDSILMGEDTPELIDVGDHRLRVISLEDLMMHRLVQQTDSNTPLATNRGRGHRALLRCTTTRKSIRKPFGGV